MPLSKLGLILWMGLLRQHLTRRFTHPLFPALRRQETKLHEKPFLALPLTETSINAEVLT